MKRQEKDKEQRRFFHSNKFVIVGIGVFAFGLYWFIGTFWSLDHFVVDPKIHYTCSQLENFSKAINSVNYPIFGKPTHSIELAKQMLQVYGCYNQ